MRTGSRYATHVTASTPSLPVSVSAGRPGDPEATESRKVAGIGAGWTLGEQPGAGRTSAEVLGSTRTVAEGAAVAATVREPAERHGVEMPVCNEV